MKIIQLLYGVQSKQPTHGFNSNFNSKFGSPHSCLPLCLVMNRPECNAVTVIFNKEELQC
jgi:hypothetical protein